MNPKDIIDEDSFRAWLDIWPKAQGKSDDEVRQIAVLIAHRCAMRVTPCAAKWIFSSRAAIYNLTALEYLRCT